MRLRLLGALAVVMMTACGTTVPYAQRQVQVQGGGVAPAPVATDGSVVDGPAPGGAAASTSGASTGTQGGARPGTRPSSGTSSAGTASVPPRAAGGAVTSPLTIGIAYPDNSGADTALGADTGNAASFKTAIRALVSAFNASGGLAGRRLVPIYYEFNSQDGNYSTDATAACAKFTQDNHVTLVLDSAFGSLGGFRACLQKKGVLHVMLAADGDDVSSSNVPLHVTAASATIDRTYSAVLNGLHATGYVGPSNQLGIIVESCEDNTRALQRTLLPLISRLGLKKPVVEGLDCTTGFGSAGTDASAISNDVLTFRSNGVDRVMFVSDYESVVLLLFGNAATAQSYHPGYLLSSNSAVQVLRGNLQSDQWPQLTGVGSYPWTDVDDQHINLSPVDQRCLSLTQKGGIKVSAYADYGYLFYECSLVFLAERALQLTHGDSRPQSLADALASLGDSFAMPGLVSNASSFSSTRHDGPSRARVFHYVASCTCMRYSGAPFSSEDSS